MLGLSQYAQIIYWTYTVTSFINVALSLESMKQYVVHIAGNVYEYKIYDILS